MRYLAILSLLFCQLSLLAQPDTLSDGTISFASVEMIPLAPGCDSLGEASVEEYKMCFQQFMIRHVGANFRYPSEARKHGVQARIFINFVIERDASVSNVEVLRGARDAYRDKSRKRRQAAKALDNEAKRVIRLLHFEKPAWVDGKEVRMSFTMPINARLQ